MGSLFCAQQRRVVPCFVLNAITPRAASPRFWTPLPGRTILSFKAIPKIRSVTGPEQKSRPCAGPKTPKCTFWWAVPRPTPQSLLPVCGLIKGSLPLPPVTSPATRPAPLKAPATRSSTCPPRPGGSPPDRFAATVPPIGPTPPLNTSPSPPWSTCPTRQRTAPCTPWRSWRKFGPPATSGTCFCSWMARGWATAWPPLPAM